MRKNNCQSGQTYKVVRSLLFLRKVGNYLMAEKKNTKKRNWAFVLYPESAPEDWKEQLQLAGLQCAISPLHDKDLNADGTPKKAHYHIILVYGNPTTYNNVKTLTDRLNKTIPQQL